MANDSLLTVVLEDAHWNSTIRVEDSAPESQGSLQIRFRSGIDPSRLVGASFDLFDWAKRAEPGFTEILIPAGTSELTATGSVTLVAVGQPGDFDVNGALDVNDLDRLTAAVRQGADLSYDINRDGMLDSEDHWVWIHELRGTHFGDANLDGEFNSNDLVQVLAAGVYETGDRAGWAEGDWNGDDIFDTSDMVAAFTDAAYEKASRSELVPEPTSTVLFSAGFVCLMAIAATLERG
jgi:hypothetical protein